MINRVGLADLGVIDFALAEALFEPFNRPVSIRVHSIVDLYLQNEVCPPFEIEAKMDTVSDRLRQSLPGPALGNADEPKHKHQQGCDDEDQFPA